MDSSASTPARALDAGPSTAVAMVSIAAAVAAVSLAAAAATDTASPWYRALDLPAWQPPGAVFGPVWAVLYVLAGVSAFLAWRATRGRTRRRLLGLYAINGVLNAGWSWLFFRAQSPELAGVEIALLLASIAVIAVAVRPHSGAAAILLGPYAAWVAFATALTWAIAAAN